MPRKFVRTTNKLSWSIEQMEAALKAVASGEPIKRTALRFGLPYSTLKDRVNAGKCFAPSLGRKCLFNTEEEIELENYITILSKVYFGMTITELRRLAFDFAETKNMKTSFCKNTRLAGKDWVYSFLKRHPTVSLKKQDSAALNKPFSADELQQFYSSLEDIVTQFNIPPTSIYNVDETGMTTDQTTCRLLDAKEMIQVGALTGWEQGKNVTICCAFSAAGHYVPPMFIFPKERMSPYLKKDGPPGAIYHGSEKGLMTAELFTEWLKHFVTHVNVSETNPVLLVMDNHFSHSSLPSYLFCKERGIHIVSIPPFTSNWLQPLEVTFFEPLKTELKKECDLFMETRVGATIAEHDFGGLFNKAYCRIANLEKAILGFEVSGIYPLNKIKFDETDTIYPIKEEPDIEILEHTYEEESNTTNPSQPSTSSNSPSLSQQIVDLSQKSSQS